MPDKVINKVVYDGSVLIDLTSDTVTAEHLESGYTAHVADGTSISGSLGPRRTSSDLTASGATVTVPSGIYADGASKAIASGIATTPATTWNVTTDVWVNSNTGNVMASSMHGKSITPTVEPGYVSSGTAGSVSLTVSGSLQLPTQAAKNVVPTIVSQTAVASGKYTTGAVTVSGDVNLIPGNIKKDVVIFGVTGTHEGGSALYVFKASLALVYNSDATVSSNKVTLTKGSVSGTKLIA